MHCSRLRRLLCRLRLSLGAVITCCIGMVPPCGRRRWLSDDVRTATLAAAGTSGHGRGERKAGCCWVICA